jgi:allophanate hydrolase
LLRFCALLLAWALLWKSAASANAATVVLDAGHGGHDPGGVPGQRYIEKHAALRITKLVQARLKAAGAICVGKTNLDQFATGLVGVRSPFGKPASAFDAQRVSGGSSSGSAVAVARGWVPFALGTDTAGSGRIPAGFNNVVGLKPTPGRVSAHGVVPACRSLDCVSVFALTVNDAACVLAVAEGDDAADAYSAFAPQQPAWGKGLRIGVPAQPVLDAAYAGPWQAALQQAQALGHTLVTLDFFASFCKSSSNAKLVLTTSAILAPS